MRCKALIVIPLCLSLVACEGSGITKQQVGMIAGAAGGALIGSQIGSGTGKLIAVAVGTLAGAWLGSEIGKRLDARDQTMMSNTTNRALAHNANGESSNWANPQSGNSGTVTPTSRQTTAQGQTCRNFNQTVSAGGEREGRQGTACQQPDGSWRIVG
jgi:surface antigen